MLQFRLTKLLGMSIKGCGDKGHQFDPRNKMRRIHLMRVIVTFLVLFPT